jgi:uncharacterized protein (TIGR00299 family) protein
MRTAYLDCASGISGDMTLGALIDAGADLTTIQSGIDSLGLPSCRLVASDVEKKGFRATQLVVEHEPEHAHRRLSQIVDMIVNSSLAERQKETATRLFNRIAEAEAKVHGTSIEEVHFHEVGAVDSIADIVGVAIAIDLLRIERIVCSPVPVGTGFVKIAHGRCGIPAPATAELLRGVPLMPSQVKAELTTPTGAVIASTLADDFGPLPAMKIESIGYGAGQRDLDEQANLLRVLIGKMESAPTKEQVWVLETNLDDVTGETVGHCVRLLADAGALDVATIPIQMKKCRPAVTISVICHEAKVAQLESILFRETTTLGIRRWPVARSVLSRKSVTVETTYGPIAGKLAWSDNVLPRFSPEYESCRQAALDQRKPLAEIYQAARDAFDATDFEDDRGSKTRE